MGFTLELKTHQFGIWHVTKMVFATRDEAAHHAQAIATRWPDLVSEWQVVEKETEPTHIWTPEHGLKEIPSDSP